MSICHIMECENACDAKRQLSTELIKQYPDTVFNEDGTVRHYAYDWDDGGRQLLRCKKCGALLLYQWSEYHSFSGNDGDSLYRDWFPVESEEEADELNLMWSPMQLGTQFMRKYLSCTNAQVMWRE